MEAQSSCRHCVTRGCVAGLDSGNFQALLRSISAHIFVAQAACLVLVAVRSFEPRIQVILRPSPFAASGPLPELAGQGRAISAVFAVPARKRAIAADTRACSSHEILSFLLLATDLVWTAADLRTGMRLGIPWPERISATRTLAFSNQPDGVEIRNNSAP